MDYIYTKEERIQGKYVSYDMLEKVLKEYKSWKIGEGKSEKGFPIPLYKIGNGSKRILLWSQMHGNESTPTRALLDIFKIFTIQGFHYSNCELYIIPMLNPDGAEAYTRINYHQVDLNRDAITRTEKESKFLRRILDEVKPDFCFNLHDQRTIFGVESLPATVSFLAPATNESRDINLVRMQAMQVITKMNLCLQKLIPGQVGRFDDSFNPNCTGDQFSLLGFPTILVEAGFFPNDYPREQTRKWIALALLAGLSYINENEVTGEEYESYFAIPENQKNFCDFCILNDRDSSKNFYIQLEEKLEEKHIAFIPNLLKIGEKGSHHAHHTLLLSEMYKEDDCDIDNITSYILAYIEEKMKKNDFF